MRGSPRARQPDSVCDRPDSNVAGGCSALHSACCHSERREGHCSRSIRGARLRIGSTARLTALIQTRCTEGRDRHAPEHRVSGGLSSILDLLVRSSRRISRSSIAQSSRAGRPSPRILPAGCSTNSLHMRSTRRSSFYGRRQCCRPIHNMRNEMKLQRLIVAASWSWPLRSPQRRRTSRGCRYAAYSDRHYSEIDRGGAVDLSPSPEASVSPMGSHRRQDLGVHRAAVCAPTRTCRGSA